MAIFGLFTNSASFNELLDSVDNNIVQTQSKTDAQLSTLASMFAKFLETPQAKILLQKDQSGRLGESWIFPPKTAFPLSTISP